jgi:hypothetical protein
MLGWALTSFPRPHAQRLDDLDRSHCTRRQKAARGHLTGSVATNLANHQRAGGDDPLKQPSAPLRSPDVPEFPNPLKMHHRYSLPNHF